MVEGVVRMNGWVFGGGLKRDCVSGEREARGWIEVILLVWVYRVPSFW